MREHLETYLALANESDPVGDGAPTYVEREFRSYLNCDILALGFARARCAPCGYDFLVAFSCRGRGVFPSGGARRLAKILPPTTSARWETTQPIRCRAMPALLDLRPHRKQVP